MVDCRFGDFLLDHFRGGRVERFLEFLRSGDDEFVALHSGEIFRLDRSTQLDVAIALQGHPPDWPRRIATQGRIIGAVIVNR